MDAKPELASLVREYKRQFQWRDWPKVLGALPPLQGRTVLDLGCGVGNLAAELAKRGAQVIGIDMNEDLLQEARSRALPGAEFRLADLRDELDLGEEADGFWCGFLAAYFPNLGAKLEDWGRVLRPGGWIALTEVDDLFGHEPLSDRTKNLFKAYTDEALAAGRYDFHMGRKLRGHLERSGFQVSKELLLQDPELSFAGPAQPDVLTAWETRFDRMKLLRDTLGADFDRAREEFLGCLAREDHRSVAKIYCCIARREA